MENNPFWQYSFDTYRKPGVATAVLALQDAFDIDVNVVLCCCWLGAKACCLSTVQVTCLIEESEGWRTQCLLPVRGVRRFLKGQAGAGVLYGKVKGLELELERWQQNLMFSCMSSMVFAEPAHTKDKLLLYNLKVYTCCLENIEWGEVEPLFNALLLHL